MRSRSSQHAKRMNGARVDIRQALEEIRQAVLEEVRRRVSDVIGRNGTSDVRTLPVLAGEVSLKKLVDEVMQESVNRASRSRPAARQTVTRPRRHAVCIRIIKQDDS